MWRLVPLLVAVLIGLWASREWELWLLWRYAVPFGQADPILGRDVGFFVYSLPFLQFVRGLLQTLVVLEVTGQQLKDALEHSAEYYKPYVAGTPPGELPSAMPLAIAVT